MHRQQLERNNTVLTEFSVKNYRLLKDLTVPKLTRINVVVGKNGTGKTALLEAFQLFCSNFSMPVVEGLLAQHDLLYRYQQTDAQVIHPGQLASKMVGNNTQEEISLFGRLAQSGDKRVCLTWSSSQGFGQAYLNEFFGGLPRELRQLVLREVALITSDASTLAKTPIQGRFVSYWNLAGAHSDNRFPAVLIDRELPAEQPCFLVNNQPQLDPTAADRWDSIVLQGAEDEAFTALQCVLPQATRLSFVSQGQNRRVPMVRLKDGRVMPLRSMGDGLARAANLAIAASSLSGGLLLVDEFEVGLHYSAQEELWRQILAMSSARDVQLVVTTHSWDTVKALAAVLREEQLDEVSLLRLEMSDSGALRAVQVRGEVMRNAAEQSVEMR